MPRVQNSVDVDRITKEALRYKPFELTYLTEDDVSFEVGVRSTISSCYTAPRLDSTGRFQLRDAKSRMNFILHEFDGVDEYLAFRERREKDDSR